MEDLAYLRQAATAAAGLLGGAEELARLKRALRVRMKAEPAQYLRLIADRGDTAAALIVSLAHMGAAMMLAALATGTDSDAPAE